ncbi:MAG: hypothetical protein AABO41_26300 [Acidobacteriota bacterium]
MIINLDDLQRVKKQAEELFPFLEPEISNYRRLGSGTPWDRSWRGYWTLESDYREELRTALEKMQDVFLRAYHCTRVPDIETIRKEGLLQLDVKRLRRDLLDFVEKELGEKIPDQLVEKWRELTEDATSYVTLRSHPRTRSLGPAFTLGLKSVFESAVRRYFVEGAETTYHIIPALLSCLRERYPSFPYDGEEFWSKYRNGLTPALVICDLPCTELPEKRQDEMGRLIIQAWLYEETEEDAWDGGHEFHADRDIPTEWISRILIPELNGWDPTFEEDIASL